MQLFPPGQADLQFCASLTPVHGGRYDGIALPFSRTDQFVELPHGGSGAGFRVSALEEHIRRSGRNTIIQGQQNCTLENHTKPHSLDVWLRQNYTPRKDTKQAVNQVVDVLVDTGRFKIVYARCPDSGRRCKGLRLATTHISISATDPTTQVGR